MQKKNSQPRSWECKRFFKEFRGHNIFLQSLVGVSKRTLPQRAELPIHLNARFWGVGIFLLCDPLGLVFTPFTSGDGPRDRTRGTKLLFLPNIPRGCLCPSVRSLERGSLSLFFLSIFVTKKGFISNSSCSLPNDKLVSIFLLQSSMGFV